MELIAETDDEILDKYFSGEELDAHDIQKGLTIGIQRGDIIPVICGSTLNNIGITEILDTVSQYLEPRYLIEIVYLKVLYLKRWSIHLLVRYHT